MHITGYRLRSLDINLYLRASNNLTSLNISYYCIFWILINRCLILSPWFSSSGWITTQTPPNSSYAEYVVISNSEAISVPAYLFSHRPSYIVGNNYQLGRNGTTGWCAEIIFLFLLWTLYILNKLYNYSIRKHNYCIVLYCFNFKF